VDQQGLAPALSRQPPEQRQLGAEDEGIVEVNDVEALDPSQARDQRCVADREGGLDPVDDGATGIRRFAVRRGREDLDLVPALRLAGGEAVAGVPRATRIWREGRRQMGDPQAAGR